MSGEFLATSLQTYCLEDMSEFGHDSGCLPLSLQIIRKSSEMLTVTSTLAKCVAVEKLFSRFKHFPRPRDGRVPSSTHHGAREQGREKGELSSKKRPPNQQKYRVAWLAIAKPQAKTIQSRGGKPRQSQPIAVQPSLVTFLPSNRREH